MKNSLAKQKLEFYVLRQVATSLNKLSLQNKYEYFLRSIYYYNFKASLNKVWQVWTSLDKFGQIWTSLKKFGQVWTSL
jgi:hypothetical protein